MDGVKGTGAKIAHTRKTTPTLSRAGAPARCALAAGQTIASGSMTRSSSRTIMSPLRAVWGEAVRRAKAHAGHMIRVCRRDRPAGHSWMMRWQPGAESVLLDNFPLDDMKAAVKACQGQGYVRGLRRGDALHHPRDCADGVSM